MNTEAEIRTAENPEFAEGLGLLDRIVAESKVAVSESERSSAKDQIAELVDEVLAGSVTVSNDLVTSLDVRIAQLDHLLSEQLNAIMHHPEFQKLESSWRGLKYLVMQSETSPMLKIKVLNASKNDLVKDFRSSSEFDQTAL